MELLRYSIRLKGYAVFVFNAPDEDIIRMHIVVNGKQ